MAAKKLKEIVFGRSDEKKVRPPVDDIEIEVTLSEVVSPATSSEAFAIVRTSQESTKYRLQWPSLFTLLLTITQIVFFGVLQCPIDFIYKNSTYLAESDASFNYRSLLLFCPGRLSQIWRFVSYMLIHLGYLHLINNVIFQLLLGVPLEMAHRWWKVMLVYIAGVVSGALASSVFNPHLPLAGASAGVYGLFGAHLANFLLNWRIENTEPCNDELEFCSFLLSPTSRLPIFVLIGAMDMVVTIWLQVQFQTANRVSAAAHFGGLLGGMFLGLRLFRLPTSRLQRLNNWLSTVFALVVLGATGWNVYTSFFNHIYIACDLCRAAPFMNRSVSAA